jgi:predicted enzyme related to lactoylglutathione lyase
MRDIINWFEIPVTDFDRALMFYSRLLEVIIQKEEVGDLVMGFFPSDDKNVSGAIVMGPNYQPGNTGVLIYLDGGNDLQDILNRVEVSGGKILLQKTLITEEIGYMAIFMDTEGNRLALHSPN